jgi:hypothetical protein
MLPTDRVFWRLANSWQVVRLTQRVVQEERFKIEHAPS